MTVPDVLKPFASPAVKLTEPVSPLVVRGNDNVLASKINEVIATLGNLQLAFADSMAIDAFGRMRVSEPVGLFDVQCQYDTNPFRMESFASGTGVAASHSASTRMVAVSCTAGSGVSAFQSYEYIPYQAGRSQMAFVTGLLGAGVAGAVVDVGLFDAANGIFLRQNGVSGLQLVRRTSTSGSVVNNTVEQASWNIDPLDGTGPSGITLDVTKVFILVIDCQYLGMGRVRIGFDIDGVVVPVHEFLNANVIATPYMQTLTLPVQMLVTATSTGSTKTSYFKCASVSSEGGFENPAAFSFATPTITATAGNGTRTHILSLRPATTFNSLTNRTRIGLSGIDILVTGSNPVFWELCVGATFSGAPTWAAVNATANSAEYTSAVGTLSGAGTVIASGFAGSADKRATGLSPALAGRFPITLDRAGAVRANGTVSLLVTGIGGSSACYATMNFTELR